MSAAPKREAVWIFSSVLGTEARAWQMLRGHELAVCRWRSSEEFVPSVWWALHGCRCTPRPAVRVERSGQEPTVKRRGLPGRSRWGLSALGGFGSLFLLFLLLSHVPRLFRKPRRSLRRWEGVLSAAASTDTCGWEGRGADGCDQGVCVRASPQLGLPRTSCTVRKADVGRSPG